MNPQHSYHHVDYASCMTLNRALMGYASQSGILSIKITPSALRGKKVGLIASLGVWLIGLWLIIASKKARDV